ncbi:MAG: hypothetical protein AABW65_02735 [Nanoarchaeota archaeon]
MKEKERRKPCCNFGKCLCCECCICICTKELKKFLSPEARKLLIKELS